MKEGEGKASRASGGRRGRGQGDIRGVVDEVDEADEMRDVKSRLRWREICAMK